MEGAGDHAYEDPEEVDGTMPSLAPESKKKKSAMKSYMEDQVGGAGLEQPKKKSLREEALTGGANAKQNPFPAGGAAPVSFGRSESGTGFNSTHFAPTPSKTSSEGVMSPRVNNRFAPAPATELFPPGGEAIPPGVSSLSRTGSFGRGISSTNVPMDFVPPHFAAPPPSTTSSSSTSGGASAAGRRSRSAGGAGKPRRGLFDGGSSSAEEVEENVINGMRMIEDIGAYDKEMSSSSSSAVSAWSSTTSSASRRRSRSSPPAPGGVTPVVYSVAIAVEEGGVSTIAEFREGPHHMPPQKTAPEVVVVPVVDPKKVTKTLSKGTSFALEGSKALIEQPGQLGLAIQQRLGMGDDMAAGAIRLDPSNLDVGREWSGIPEGDYESDDDQRILQELEAAKIAAEVRTNESGIIVGFFEVFVLLVPTTDHYLIAARYNIARTCEVFPTRIMHGVVKKIMLAPPRT